MLPKLPLCTALRLSCATPRLPLTLLLQPPPLPDLQGTKFAKQLISSSVPHISYVIFATEMGKALANTCPCPFSCPSPPSPDLQGPKFAEQLTSLDPATVPIIAAAKLARVVAEPDFNIVTVGQVRKAQQHFHL